MLAMKNNLQKVSISKAGKKTPRIGVCHTKILFL